MKKPEQRARERYKDFARIEAPELCMLPGILMDINELGCRVRFPIPVELNPDSECELNVHPSCKDGLAAFSLTVKPVWSKCGDTASEAGFHIVGASDPHKLSRYLDVLYESTLDPEEQLIKELCL